MKKVRCIDDSDCNRICKGEFYLARANGEVLLDVYPLDGGKMFGTYTADRFEDA